MAMPAIIASIQCLRLGAVAGGLCVTSAELALPTLSPALLERAYLAAYGAPPREQSAYRRKNHPQIIQMTQIYILQSASSV